MRETRDDQGFDSRFDAAFQPGFRDDGAGLLAEFDEAAPDESEMYTGRAPRRGRLVDRFVVVLWIVGAAMILAGGASAAITVGFYGNAPINFTPDYFMISVLSQSSQWFVPVGLVTLVGTLFLLAVRWERRP